MSSLPKLRFPGFEGEWEEKSLGDVVCLDLKPIEKPAEAYVRLRVRSHGKGTFYETVDNPQTIEMETLCEVKENQLLVNITFAWEHAICVTNQEDAGKIVSHRFPTYSFNEDNVPAFYKYYILLPRFKYYLGVASPGGAGRNRVLNKTAFLELLVPKPSSEEQTKIADFFTLIDKKITRQDEKVAALKQYKKGLMQKIFSREIRFKDNNGKDYPEWEAKRLKDLGSISSGVGFSETYQGLKGLEVSVFKVSDMNLPGNNKYMINANNTISLETCKIMKTKPVNGPAIIFAKVGAAIFLERKRISTNLFLVDNNMMYLIPKTNNCVEFIYYLLINTRLSKLSQVGALPSYNASDVGIIKVNIPSLPEQTKIANFLSLYDRKIEKEKAKLEALQEQKKGLLHQMFV